MKYTIRFFYTCILWWTHIMLNAQSLTSNPITLNFQTLFETKADTKSVYLKNITKEQLQVLGIRQRSLFRSKPFSFSDTAFSLDPGAEKRIVVTCRIKHNVPNDANLIFLTNSSQGDYTMQVKAQGKYSKSYYSVTENLSEEPLKQALKTKIGQGYVSLGYNDARDLMYGTLDNVSGTVTCIYTGRTANFNDRAGAASNNFNCEHTFPQGFFSQNEPMRSDVHHLFSTDENANNSRGNQPFGIAIPPLIQTAINAPSKNDGTRYEPQDSHKGNCARGLLYFVLRYQDYSNFFAPMENMLKNWSQQFPPLPKDTLRNSRIFAAQKNRNPFVDYPQLADRISKLVTTSSAPLDYTTFLSRPSEDFGTVHVDSSKTFDMVFSNFGNQNISIVSLITQNPDFSVLSPAANTQVKPGEAVTIRIQAKPSSNGLINSNLILTTNIPGGNLFNIPLVVNGTSSATGFLKENKTGSFWPNPASNNVHFTSKTSGRISFFNALGKEVLNANLESGENEISIKGLPKGIYHLKTETGNVRQLLIVE